MLNFIKIYSYPDAFQQVKKNGKIYIFIQTNYTNKRNLE